MNGNWKESDSRSVKLPKDDPATFGIYVNLLYTKQIPTKPTFANSRRVMLEYIHLARLYVLCEKLQDIEGKNSTIHAMLSTSRDNISVLRPNAIKTIYEGTPESSPARKMLLDMYVEYGNNMSLHGGRGNYPKQFLFDLAVQLLQSREFVGPKTLATCDIGKYQEKAKSKDKDTKLEQGGKESEQNITILSFGVTQLSL